MIILTLIQILILILDIKGITVHIHIHTHININIHIFPNLTVFVVANFGPVHWGRVARLDKVRLR